MDYFINDKNFGKSNKIPNSNIISSLVNMKRNEDLIGVLKNVAENRNLGFIQNEFMIGLKYLKDAVMIKELYEIFEIMFKSSKKEFDEKFFCTILVKYNLTKQQHLLKVINENNVSISKNFPALVINSLIEDNQIKNAIITFFNFTFSSFTLLNVSTLITKIYENNLFIFFYNYFRKYYLFDSNKDLFDNNCNNANTTNNNFEIKDKISSKNSSKGLSEKINESYTIFDNDNITDSLDKDKNEFGNNTTTSLTNPSQDILFSYFIEEEMSENHDLNELDPNTIIFLSKIESNIRNNELNIDKQNSMQFFNENITESDIIESNYESLDISPSFIDMEKVKKWKVEMNKNKYLKLTTKETLELEICESILQLFPK